MQFDYDAVIIGGELYDGFVPDVRLWKQIFKGLRRWWKCELFNSEADVEFANEGSGDPTLHHVFRGNVRGLT